MRKRIEYIFLAFLMSFILMFSTTAPAIKVRAAQPKAIKTIKKKIKNYWGEDGDYIVSVSSKKSGKKYNINVKITSDLHSSDDWFYWLKIYYWDYVKHLDEWDEYCRDIRKKLKKQGIQSNVTFTVYGCDNIKIYSTKNGKCKYCLVDRR